MFMSPTTPDEKEGHFKVNEVQRQPLNHYAEILNILIISHRIFEIIHRQYFFTFCTSSMYSRFHCYWWSLPFSHSTWTGCNVELKSLGMHAFHVILNRNTAFFSFLFLNHKNVHVG